jgi:glycosyltransferase involved in cell wall biosynthesis
VDLAACRFWVMAHAWLAEGVLDPAMPYAVYAPDFIPRYVPEIYGPPDLRHPVWPIMLRQFRMMRDARCVFATTPHTAGDAVVYAGVRRERLLTMPLFAELPDAAAAGAPADAAPYIVWVTNTTPHKNHLVALDALAIYYRELGGTLVVRACGPGTLHFAPGPRSGFVSPYWVDVALRVASDAVLRDRVQWLGEVDGDAYARLLGGAAFLWHPAAYDNGTFAAIDAGRLGRAVVSSDYPQMRHIAGEFGLAADFAPPRDPRAMAGLLKAAEDRHRAGTLTGTFAVPAGYRQRVRDAFVELVDRVGGADPAAARAGR